jgi:hypothetical protein
MEITDNHTESSHTKIFKPLIVKTLETLSELNNHTEGIYMAELLKEAAASIEQLLSDGAPPNGFSQTFYEMVLNDEILTNTGTTFSMMPLEGYKKWSDHVRDKAPGFRFNEATLMLEDDSHVPLNFEILQKILLNKDKH